MPQYNITPKSGALELKDKWAMIIGIPLVILAAPIAFGHYFNRIDNETIFALVGGTFSTLIMWLGVRGIVIFLWDKYPWVKNPIKHLVIEIAAILGYTAIVGFLFFILYKLLKIEVDFQKELPQNILFSLIITFLITSIHEGYFFFRQWKTWLSKSEKLQEENIRSQYETLKNQINPHFLFNNLNTLANLIEENPPAAVLYVNRTADYYRKILSMGDQEVIMLSQEMELVNDYIFLQQSRFGENLKTEINIPSTILSTFVAPLSLQMLVENAITHNIISKEKPLTISISCPDLEKITISNNLQIRYNEQPSSKLGLKNIQLRYEYFTNKRVEIVQNEDHFSVSVPILNL